MTRKDRNTYLLSTGREVSANCGIVGLNPSDFENVYEGFDGYIVTPWEDWNDPEFRSETSKWTPAEKAELADYMIDAWRAFKAGVI